MSVRAKVMVPMELWVTVEAEEEDADLIWDAAVDRVEDMNPSEIARAISPAACRGVVYELVEDDDE